MSKKSVERKTEGKKPEELSEDELSQAQGGFTKIEGKKGEDLKETGTKVVATAGGGSGI